MRHAAMVGGTDLSIRHLTDAASSRSARAVATLARVGLKTQNASPSKVMRAWSGQSSATRVTTSWSGDEGRRDLAGSARPHR